MQFRTPAPAPLSTPKSYEQNIAEFVQRQQAAHPYNTSAPMAAPQSPMGTTPTPSATPLGPLAQIALKESLFGGESAAAPGVLGGSSGADVLALGQTMPTVGPTVESAATIAPESSMFASAGIPAAAAIATLLGGRSGLRMLQGKQKNWKHASLADNAGRATLAIATGGLSEVANKLFGGHRSTQDRQQGRWKSLYNDGKVPDFFMSDPNINQDMGVDDNKLASGKLGGRDVWATSGMFDTFGKDWATTGNEAQREQIAKAMLDKKLFDTKKGVTYVTNQDEARKIKDEILGAPAPKKAK
jgi:hypothetical protein